MSFGGTNDGLELVHDGPYDTVNAAVVSRITIRMIELDEARFVHDFVFGNPRRGVDDATLFFSDIERRINMRSVFRCDVEILPGPSNQTSTAYAEERSGAVSSSIETGITNLTGITLSGFDRTTINRIRSNTTSTFRDPPIQIEGSSGRDQLLVGSGSGFLFTGNGNEIRFLGTGVQFDGSTGQDELIVTGARTAAAYKDEIDLDFRPDLFDARFKTLVKGFEQNTFVSDGPTNAGQMYLFANDNITVSPDRATVSNAGITTTAIGFSTYTIAPGNNFDTRPTFGTNVVYNNQNDPTLVQTIGGVDVVFDSSPRNAFTATFRADVLSTDRAEVQFLLDDSQSGGNIRIANP